MNEIYVWECLDLRREIFSYLRKNPQLICVECSTVLIWDKQIKPHLKIPFLYTNPDGYYCVNCWRNYIPMSNHPCVTM